MAFTLPVKCALVYGFLSFGFPVDKIDIDLKVYMVKEIHIFKKYYKTQITQYSPWGGKVQLYPSFRRKEFLNRQNKINTPYAGRPIRHKIQRKTRRDQVTLIPKQSRKRLKKIPISRGAITHKRTATNSIPSPVIGNYKTMNWNMKTEEILTQNEKEAAKDTSIRGNIQPA